MTEPLVSVLSITYNHAPYIAQAIESFLAQETNFPFEIVIGEDCSTDGTREIVFDYATRYLDRIRIVTSDKNVGGIVNFQRTLADCRGKYVAVCEGDDYWQHSGKLQMQADFLEANPEYGMVHTDWDVIDTRTDEVVKSYCKSRGFNNNNQDASVDDILLGRNGSATATMCMRRSLIDEIISNDPSSFDGRYPMGDLSLRVGAAYYSRIKFLDVSTASYRLLIESLSQNQDPTKILEFSERIYELVMHLSEHYKCSTHTRSVIHRKSASRVLADSFWAGDVDTASELLCRFKKRDLPVPLIASLCFYALKWRVLGTLCKRSSHYVD